MIAIISDIHGNYPALKAVLNEIDRIGCEKVISLGDVAGYYCMINECIEELRTKGIINILGNHDKYIITGTICPRSSSANICLEYQNKIITKENRLWLTQSKIGLSIGDIDMVHGGWLDPVDEYLYHLDKGYFEKLKAKMFFSGHTHIQIIKDFGEKRYCNPGSVGQPRDRDWRASFVVYEPNKGTVYLKRVEYDVEAIIKAMRNAEFKPYFYENLYLGTRIGGLISSII